MADEVAPGLWRWTAPHPAWRPGAEAESEGDWEREVGCVLVVDDDGATFVDPLVPGEASAPFWAWADEVVGGRPVSVLTTIRFHGRSGPAVAERYGAAMGETRSGIEAFAFPAADETMFWLRSHRALVPGDRILGDGHGGVRLCPESWLHYFRRPLSLSGLQALLAPLLALPVERILVSHGAPVLSGGAAALRRIL
ncbi:MAG TPA: hypothetical protein VE571_09945 [Solirubrobacteraceae bacterium]|nr:hypothetical protein [Solirubrobacteraceae bacterium]